jgi:glutamine synthetase
MITYVGSRFVIYLAFAAIITGLLLGIYAGIQIGNEGIIGLVRSSSKKLASYIDSSI